MDVFAFFFGILGIGFILAGPIAFIIAMRASGRSKRLEKRIDDLSSQVLDLDLKQTRVERKLAAAPPPIAAAPAARAEEPPPPALSPHADVERVPISGTPVIAAPSRGGPTPAPPAHPWPETFPPVAEATPAKALSEIAPPPAPIAGTPARAPAALRVPAHASSITGAAATPDSAPARKVSLPPPAPMPAAAAPRDIGTLEATIGGSWLNKIGVSLLVIGIAFALGYSFTNLGPPGKAFLATTVSLAMIGAGLFLERRETYRLYGRGLIAGGWAALYATAYAVHELEATRIVKDPFAGFALLILVGAGMIVHSLRYESEGITALAYALAYAAIALHSISAYTLAAGAVLGLGTVLHLLRRRWYVIAFGGLAATYGSLFLWYVRQGEMSAQTLRLGLGALLLDWITFLVADFSPEPDLEKDRGSARIVSLMNAVAAGGLSYLAWSKFSPAGAWLPLAIFGALYAVTSGVLRHLGRRSVHPIHSVAAVLLIGLAAREGLDLHGATWIWLAEAQAVVLLGVYLEDRFHRILGCVLFLAPSIAIFRDQIGERLDRVEGIWNPHQFALSIAACAAFYLTFARLKAFAGDGAGGRFEELLRRLFSYGALVLVMAGLWVQLPRVYVAPAGAALMILLFELSSLRLTADLRAQSYVAAAFTIASALALSAPSKDLLLGHAARIPALLAVSVSFFVVFLRRRGEKASLLELEDGIRRVLPWAGAAFTALIIWLEARPAMVGPAWIVMALLLVEAGIALGERDLRRPGYALLLGGHASLLLSNLTAGDLAGGWSIRAVTIAPAIAAMYYLWWRLRELGSEPAAGARAGDATDEGFGRFLCYAGGIMTGMFVRFEFGLEGAALRWSLAMVALFVAGYLLRDADFRIQAYALAIAVFIRAAGFDFQEAGRILGVDGPLAVAAVSVACFLGAGLFLRSRARSPDELRRDRRSLTLEAQLEARGFDLMSFLAVAASAVYSFHAHSGFMLIVAWAVEGLLATAAGFLLEARTLRLAGLGLLTVGLAMTLYLVTTFGPVGRIVSFLVLGVVLLLVSFGYTRYRGALRKAS